MIFNSELNKETFLEFYSQNKDYIVPIVVSFISFVLFLMFTVPQLTSVPQKNTERNTEVAKLNKLKSSTSFASSTSPTLLDSQIKSASMALPPAKDFESIINGITSAAAASNVTITSYSLASSSEVSKFPTILFNLVLDATPAQAINFINELYKSYPLSEVTGIEASDSSSKLSISFYYKPYPPVGFEDRVGIREMSVKEKSAYDEILTWNVNQEDIFDNTSIASDSGQTTDENSELPF